MALGMTETMRGSSEALKTVFSLLRDGLADHCIIGIRRASIPCMAHADAVIYITESKLEQLVGQDASGISKPKERVVGKDGPQTHGARVQNRLIAETAQAAVSMDNLNLLADANVAKDGEERKDGGEGRLAVDAEKRDVVDLEAVGEVAHAFAVVGRVRDDDDLVPAVNQLAGDLVDVRLDAAGLREEEVADHGDVVRFARHDGDGWGVAGGVEIMVWRTVGLSRLDARPGSESVRFSVNESKGLWCCDEFLDDPFWVVDERGSLALMCRPRRCPLAGTVTCGSLIRDHSRIITTTYMAKRGATLI